MTQLGYQPLFRLRLLSRNEGKIKSYESCTDLRAWSHDIGRRDDYLKEWIKTDTPISVLPVKTLIYIVKKMTYTSKGKTMPRCHPRCKSKFILESICKSCNKMKECLRNEENFDRYFLNEEFETSNWPCEACLEALKSIKMFWTIIIEKIFRIKLNKRENISTKINTCTDCVRCVSQVWQNEMVEQAMFVKSITHFLDRTYLPWRLATRRCSYHRSPPRNIRFCDLDHDSKYKDLQKTLSRLSLKSSRGYVNIKCPRLGDTRSSNKYARSISNATNTRRLTIKPSKSSTVRFCKQVSLKPDTVDVGCECTSLTDEISAMQTKLSSFKDKFHTKTIEVEKLTEENESLKKRLRNRCQLNWPESSSCASTKLSSLKDKFHTKPIKSEKFTEENEFLKKELRNVCQQDWSEFSTCAPSTTTPGSNTDTNVPKSIGIYEDSYYVKPSKPVDSELIITMKNCKDESFKHISLLQVLHKTNTAEVKASKCSELNCKREDPLVLLAKVQNKFGAIVSREMSMVSRQKGCIDVDAAFHVSGSRSGPTGSRTTLSTNSSEFTTAHDMRSIGQKCDNKSSR